MHGPLQPHARTRRSTVHASRSHPLQITRKVCSRYTATFGGNQSTAGKPVPALGGMCCAQPQPGGDVDLAPGQGLGAELNCSF